MHALSDSLEEHRDISQKVPARAVTSRIPVRGDAIILPLSVDVSAGYFYVVFM